MLEIATAFTAITFVADELEARDDLGIHSNDFRDFLRGLEPTLRELERKLSDSAA
jgi:hypothetical protein